MDRNEKIRTYNYSRNSVTDHRCAGLVRQVPNLSQFFQGNAQGLKVVQELSAALRKQHRKERLDELLRGGGK